MKGTTLKIISIAVTAVLLIVAIVGTIAVNLEILKNPITNYLIGWKEPEMSEERGVLAAQGDDLAELILLEGAVLAKNENNLLPLKSDAVKKLNVFGWSSSSWVPAGSGSGRTRQNMAVDALENPDAPYTGRPAWSNYSAGSLYAEIDIYGALMKYGIGYNESLRNFYLDYNGRVSSSLNIGNRPYYEQGTLSAYDYQYSRLVEPSLSEYPSGALDDAKAYSDYAVVVISRVSGESNDSPKVQYKGAYNSNNRPSPQDSTRHYLEISTEEEALLTHVGANYPGKTIVLINSTNTMELGFMETIPGLSSCLVVGATGPRAATAIPKLMFDKVTYKKVAEGMEGEPNSVDKWETVTEDGYSPSGRFADTYAYDFKTNPSWASMGHPETSNFGVGAPDRSGQKYYNLNGNNKITGNTDLYALNIGSGNYPGSPRYAGLAYVDYMESIYVGYKWYETADKTGYWSGKSTSKTPDGKSGYDAVVQYPFGHGESYTTFKHEIFDSVIVRGGEEITNNKTILKDDTIRIKVRVINTGDVAAKEVVQIYYEPPYKSGQVEKSSANLVAFKKTQIIQPGEPELLTLDFDAYDMASYDCYNKSGKVGADGGYILDGGSYAVKVMDNAHEPAKGLSMEQATLSFTVADAGIVYTTDPVTGSEVKNRFTGDAAKLANGVGDGVPADGSEESVPVKYLTRAGFAASFPAGQEQRDLTEDVRALNRYTHNSDKALAWNAANQPEGNVAVGLGDNGKRLSTGSGKTFELTELGYELGNADNYNSEKWYDLLSQLTTANMEDYCRQTGTNTKAMPIIGVPQSPTLDGPAQVGGWPGGVNQGTGFPNATVLAQTFNIQLSYKMGLQVGNDLIASGLSNGGWLAPGLNIHRSPLGSRNYEYYSEDPVLSGKMAARVIQGCRNKGVYVYIKHLALYDQDNNRDSLYTWLTEQSLREIYLKPFRIAIQEGGATGLMTAYNRIGAVWTGGSYPLMTGIIRNEMGFKGAIVTDYVDRDGYMDISHALRGGGDIQMAGRSFSSWENKNDQAYLAALRRASRNIAYTWLEAKYTESNYDPDNDPLNETIAVSAGERIPNFNWLSFLVIPALYVLAAGGGVFIFFAFRKKNVPDGESA